VSEGTTLRKAEVVSVGAKVMRKHVNNAVQVGVEHIEYFLENARNGIFGSTLVRLSSCTLIDLEDSPSSEVRPVPHTRVQLVG